MHIPMVCMHLFTHHAQAHAQTHAHMHVCMHSAMLVRMYVPTHIDGLWRVNTNMQDIFLTFEYIL